MTMKLMNLFSRSKSQWKNYRFRQFVNFHVRCIRELSTGSIFTADDRDSATYDHRSHNSNENELHLHHFGSKLMDFQFDSRLYTQATVIVANFHPVSMKNTKNLTFPWRIEHMLSVIKLNWVVRDGGSSSSHSLCEMKKLCKWFELQSFTFSFFGDRSVLITRNLIKFFNK